MRYKFEGKHKSAIHVIDSVAENVERVNKGVEAFGIKFPACHCNDMADLIIIVPDDWAYQYLVVPSWFKCTSHPHLRVERMRGKDHRIYKKVFINQVEK